MPLLACVASATWVATLAVVVPYHRRHGYFPRAVQEALFVAVLAAALGGALASLGFVHLLSEGASAAAASAWRTALLASGCYALIAAWRARGR